MTDQADIRSALEKGGVIDITTTGRKSGQARRIEIVFFAFDGRIYISGSPGRRGWIANLEAEPHLTFHLKKGLTADLPAVARVIADDDERRPIIERVCIAWSREEQTEAFLAGAPLIEVSFEDESLLAA
jgi:deazaflavin-dependent oxidoreductase (nitroreductase family)